MTSPYTRFESGPLAQTPMCMPASDSPTVEVRVGGCYRTHYGTTVFECVSDQPGINPATGLWSDARFTITDGIETYRCHADGRQHRSVRTFMDLVAEA